jgi:ribosomal protein S12 methylthiotransferase accessory factor
MDVYVCRIIIPEISEIYPVIDLLYSNNNIGAVFREEILSLNELNYDQRYDLLDRLSDSELDDGAKVAEFLGLVPEKESLWATITLAEIKAMLSLSIKDYEDAMEFNTMLLYGNLDENREHFYKCLQAILEIKIDAEKEFHEYEESLTFMYSKQNVQTCLDIIEGKINFYGLDSPSLVLNGFTEHKKLIEKYKKLHKAKINGQ